MKKMLTRPALQVALVAATVGGLLAWSGHHNALEASSHREAPLIADDPLADNTDLYVFRSPDAATNDGNATVTIVANYIPFELPQGGPNFNSFGENIRYEIHVKNSTATTGDDITYRFTFTRTNQDPTTFFRVRLGKENLKTTYKLEQSLAGGAFTTLFSDGIVAAPNIGPRSINGAAGYNITTDYETASQGVVKTTNGMKVFCGPRDDAFFTDLGAIFDLGGVRAAGAARDGLARKNVHSIVMQIPVSALVKSGTAALSSTTSILDPNYIIGVWASASRPAIRTLNPTTGGQSVAVGPTVAPTTGYTGSPDGWVQVSRLGMPLTNEVVQAIGLKDEWNAGSPYGSVSKFDAGAKNPELALYMADNTPVNGAAAKPTGQTYYGEAVPGFAPLRIQTKSLAGLLPSSTGLQNGFDFRNGAPGLAPIFGNALTNGTALAPSASGGFGEYLLNNGQSGSPRTVDILPIFHTGVPNLIPYQLATGKTGGNPLTAGKPFINNFLPTFGDMLRINLAVPPTSRTSADFSSEGLLAAAVLGLTDARYNGSNALQLIPNMDGFPNGRRLEDDVTRIELQAVGGVVLAAIGLWYDDYNVAASPAASPVTAQLGNVLGFSTNVTKNDTTFRTTFPYAQTPWSGTNAQRVALAQLAPTTVGISNLATASAYPNPLTDRTTLHFELATAANLSVQIRDVMGRLVGTIPAKNYPAGVTEIQWQPAAHVVQGQYIASIYAGTTLLQSLRIQRQ